MAFVYALAGLQDISKINSDHYKHTGHEFFVPRDSDLESRSPPRVREVALSIKNLLHKHEKFRTFS